MDNNLLKTTTKNNIKYLEDIKKYNEVHENDFKQVFFKPDPAQIKSSLVGVFVKDIYGNDQVNPVKQIDGYHTEESCKLNTAIYANSQIDYNSPKNYVPGVNEVKVEGDFANSPNFFLNNASTVAGQTFSVEITGYIAAQTPGKYTVSTDFFKKNALIWIGNNALKTYRKENAMFLVDNGSVKKNQIFRMVAGEYIPFRIQYSGDTQFDYKTQPLWKNGDGDPITVFATNKNENNLYYYSLLPSEKSTYYNCNVYKGSDLQNYKTDAKQQVKIAWNTSPLNDETAYVFLDMVGNLCAYNSNYEKIGEPIFSSQGTIAGKYNLELYEKKIQPLFIKKPDNTMVPLITIDEFDAVTNQEWAKESNNPTIKVMSNKEELIGEKMISVNRISETTPFFSENFQYKLCIMKNRENQKILALLVSTTDLRKFYTAEPDYKMNKLFYASTYPENKFLREVPDDLQTTTNTYTSYSDMYPYGKYAETAYSENNNCEIQCNQQQCNHFYKVTNASGASNCLISNDPVTTFLPRQPDSKYASSELKIRNKNIKTGDATKDRIYDKTEYVVNGYLDTMNLGFSEYPVEKTPLSKSDTPGPNGTSYIVELQNNVSESTIGTRPFSITNINNPMNAGKIERFTSLKEKDSVVKTSLTKLDEIDNKMAEYGNHQKQIDKTRIDISNNITSIDDTYLDMSGNPQKYNFTGQTIYALEEDRSLSAILLKDNAIYNGEQNRLYIITTIALATFLVTAILISR